MNDTDGWVGNQLIGAVVGFLLGWVSFELTELRRRRIQTRSGRQSLKGELSILEVVLSTLLLRFSQGIPDPSRAVAEYRWYLKEGRARWRFSQVPDDVADKLSGLTDEQIKKLLSSHKDPLHQQTAKIRVPILDSILSAQTPGFSVNEIQLLTDLRWQLTMLEKQIELMDEYGRMTFTVTDPTNHQIVVDNQKRSEDGFRMRLGYVLDHLRELLAELNRPSCFAGFCSKLKNKFAACATSIQGCYK